MGELIDRLSIRNKLYDADAITMRGVAMLNQEPAVDAAPVVHGRWELENNYGSLSFVCSECGFMRGIDENFGAAISCPNCGAKMDVEEANDKDRKVAY